MSQSSSRDNQANKWLIVASEDSVWVGFGFSFLDPGIIIDFQSKAANQLWKVIQKRQGHWISEKYGVEERGPFEMDLTKT